VKLSITGRARWTEQRSVAEMQQLQQPIAIVGMGSLFPGSESKEGFWKDIVEARDRMIDVPESHWLIEDYYHPDPSHPDRTYSKRGGFLSPVEFDPMEFGIPPNLLPSTDTSQLLALIVARNVLADMAGQANYKIDRERTSVILGFTGVPELTVPLSARLQRPIWVKALRESGVPEEAIEGICDRIARSYQPWTEASFPGLLGSLIAGRVANRLDLHGTNMTTDAACASALAAVHTSVNQLLLGESDLVITGGVDANNDILCFMCFSKTPALSQSGDCRPFSEKADGTMMGEGLGMMALKRLDDAERDGNKIYAVIRGIGSASDGRNRSIYAPRGDGQARALRRAYDRAGYGPETVELVEAHGTGTRAGDAAEVEGLKLVFGAAAADRGPWCALGSVKSQIGHTKAAAGAAGLLKVAMALHKKVLPPTLKIEQPDPDLKLSQSPFYLNTALRPWVRSSHHPRRASISSFGFGGTNYHVALEEYVGKECRSSLRTMPNELFLFSGESAEALAERCSSVTAGGADFALQARESQHAFHAEAPIRAAVVADSAEDLRTKLKEVVECLKSSTAPSLTTPGGVFVTSNPPEKGSLAMLFPGQGSQYVGMGAEQAMFIDSARQVWDSVADLRFDGKALHEITFPRPVFSEAEREANELRLRSTEWAQPALGVAAMASYSIAEELGLKPSCLIGHSFGELTALCAAGSFGLADLLRLARVRGELMREASAEHPGGMLAMSASASEAADLIKNCGCAAVVANQNAPEETVVSGPIDSLEALEAACREKAIKARRLPVAAAFHSSAVAPAAARFAQALGQVRVCAPTVPVSCNTDAQIYPSDSDSIRERLAGQLAKPVLFAEQIENAWKSGVRIFVEVGPGSVLSDLTRRILTGKPHIAISLDRKSRHGITSLHHALGQLAVAGQKLNLESLWKGYVPPVDLPQRSTPKVMLSGTNYGKLYPPSAKQKAIAAAAPTPKPLAMGASRPLDVSSTTGATHEQRIPSDSTHRADSTHRSDAARLPVTQAPLPSKSNFVPDSSSASNSEWIQAFQDVQKRTAETHAAFSKAMSDSHAAFLSAMESSFAQFSTAMRGGVPMPRELEQYTPQREAQRIVPLVEPAPIATVRPPKVETPKPQAEAPTKVDLKALLLSIVADKTGYQQHMLTLDMDLEADLGIDSIKRVEILAALQDAVPSLPQVQPSEMAAIRTLGDVISQISNFSPQSEIERSTPPPVATPKPKLEASPTELLLQIVAEKTGYEKRMLDLSMDLEADLGVDSIKRVEILAAVRDSIPELPELAPSDLAAVRTLHDVVAALSGVKRSAKADSEPAAVERCAVDMEAATALGLSLPGLRDAKRLVITNDEGGVAEALQALLTTIGINAQIVAQVPMDADAVVLLDGLKTFTSIDQAIAINRKAFQAARAVAPSFTNEPGIFVTVQDTGGDFGRSGKDPVRAWSAGMAALVRAARHEWPRATLKAIDCERGARDPREVAAAIFEELMNGAEAAEVGLGADGSRRVPKVVQQPNTSTRLKLPEGSVVIASGGARGVTAQCLIELARESRPRLVLLGRTPLMDEPSCCGESTEAADLTRALVQEASARGQSLRPGDVNEQVRSILANREIRKTIEAIRREGGQAEYIAVDVQDRAALAEVLRRVRAELGPIRALIHGAGVLSDKRIADKTDERFDFVFQTKVLGLRSLLDATQTDNLAWICIFSSIVATTGNEGQADYAMGNEVLNHVAEAEKLRRGPECVVRCLGWGPWDSGMVTPALRRRFEERGISVIPTQSGAQAFVAEYARADRAHVLLGGGQALAMLPSQGETCFELWLDSKQSGYLRDHAVNGVPVVPMVLVGEWFLRAMKGLGQGEVRLHSLKVIRGVRLDAALAGTALRILRRFDGNEWILELRNAAGAICYTAKAEFGTTGVEPTIATAPIVQSMSLQEIYDGVVLFHGPAFQVLRKLELTDTSATADLGGMSGEHWDTAAPWQIDPAAMDGMVQAAARLAVRMTGGAVLPMAFESMRVFRRGALHTDLRATVQARGVRGSGAVCDAVLATASGVPIAEVSGIEFVVRPDVQLLALASAAAS
jgi:acyl transferase domain-containing protein